MDLEILKKRMVKEQLIPRGISDRRVLEAFDRVQRHKFVPLDMQKIAYADNPLPVGEGQTISQPYMVALMTEKLALKGDEKVLEIGTGSGYQAAILAELAKEIYSIERFTMLAERARETLECTGYKNVKIMTGDGTLGWGEYAPFDRIIVTAGAPHIPETLFAQLKEGGRMVIPVGGGLSQVLTVVEKEDGRIKAHDICGCVFVPLVGKEGWKN